MNFILLAKLLIILTTIVISYFLTRKKLTRDSIILVILTLLILGFATSGLCNALPLFKDKVEIAALNERGASSNSTQIFISGFTIDRKEYKVEKAVMGHWLWAGINNDLYAWLPEGHPGRTENISDSVTLLIPEGNTRIIHFLEDKYCGLAKITINGRTQIVDTSIEDKAEIGPSSLGSQILYIFGYVLILLILFSIAALFVRIIHLKKDWIATWLDHMNVDLIYKAAQNAEINKIELNVNKEIKNQVVIGKTMLSFLNSIPIYYIFTFLSTTIIGVMIHIYMMTNKFPNPDDMMHMFDLGAGTIGGRWGLDILSAPIPFLNTSILPLFSMPWFNGLAALIYIAIAACFSIQVLKIRHLSSCILISGIMVAFPTVAASLQYMFTAPSYFLSLALAAFSVYLTKKYRYGFIVSAFILCFVLSIYQAFFFYAAGLFVASLLLECTEYNSSTLRIVLEGLKYFGVLILAITLYFVSVKISLIYFDTELTSYAGLNEMGNISLLQFPQMIKNAYTQFFLIPNIVEEMAAVRRLVLIVSGICSIINLIYIFIYRKIYRETLMPFLLVLFSVMFPLACESIYLTNAAFYHELMIYPMVLPTVLTIALAERYGETLRFEMQEFQNIFPIRRGKKSFLLKKTMYYFPLLLSLALILNYAIITNEEYLAQHMSYEQAYSYLNRLAVRMEETEGYTYDTPVAFIGNINNSSKPSVMSDFESLTGLIGFNFDGEYPNENALLKNENSINCYMLKEYLGVVVHKATDGQCDEVRSAEEFSKMPTYPEKGSIKIINGVLAVKFEDQ